MELIGDRDAPFKEIDSNLPKCNFEQEDAAFANGLPALLCRGVGVCNNGVLNQDVSNGMS